MVTVNRVGGQSNEKGSEIYGVSTDTKPIDNEIPNGSIFMEMNTGLIYFYDAEAQQWVQPQTN